MAAVRGRPGDPETVIEPRRSRSRQPRPHQHADTKQDTAETVTTDIYRLNPARFKLVCCYDVMMWGGGKYISIFFTIKI